LTSRILALLTKNFAKSTCGSCPEYDCSTSIGADGSQGTASSRLPIQYLFNELKVTPCLYVYYYFLYFPLFHIINILFNTFPYKYFITRSNARVLSYLCLRLLNPFAWDFCQENLVVSVDMPC
jgi:hypothetical protein